MERRTLFPGRVLPALLILPQLVLTGVFFLWPALQAITSSLEREDAFGTSTEFVGLDNFADLFGDPLYLAAIGRTLVFCACVTAIAMGVALVLAVLADTEIRGRAFYRTMLIWPYAVAPAMAAVLWVLMFHPQIGLVGAWLNRIGIAWDYKLDGTQAMALVVLAAAWKQVSYNFIFFLAGLQAIPKTIIEAARIDGARGVRRFRTIVLPLLMPTVYFLLVVDLVYAAFDTFATVYAVNGGGPGQSTQTLVLKVYLDGVVNANVGSSSAQSVVLMAGVIVLCALQFRFLGRKAAT
ncbi:sn-glycerol-3-phosphate transport system permease protein UgpA [Methylobacterium cerastii]|uniref:sn-glycerol-3-phosphate transport system permease protein UgpA n=1 Tax=Methylobacterium cerastii TaxID=932741 RepID=A0ABQ4QHD9_9HYPH|nr:MULTISPECIES: ABC transporter permease subunit [Methylobacterium]TXN14492.1 ABC transporter permease subunit [Methylobacterium sp. WL122]TXN82320.1 ABC transporter permease subunit [Methylobacterium sp. WL8]GJD44537.1 sn-glycerol-3-phosphate transport system permease protein UgpA [Methylobacterium cerastii]